MTTVCLLNPGCTAIQTWGLSDKYSWIPEFFPGFGAALPFDMNYQPKPAVTAMLDALRATPPLLAASSIVNAASYKGGAVAPGELITIFGVNYGPATLVGAQLDTKGLVSTNLSGTQVFFDGVPAPFIYALAGQVSAAGQTDWKAVLAKHFRIKERGHLEFRFEGYDILHHPNFSDPNTTVTSSAFGPVTSQAGLSREFRAPLSRSF